MRELFKHQPLDVVPKGDPYMNGVIDRRWYHNVRRLRIKPTQVARGDLYQKAGGEAWELYQLGWLTGGAF